MWFFKSLFILLMMVRDKLCLEIMGEKLIIFWYMLYVYMELGILIFE